MEVMSATCVSMLHQVANNSDQCTAAAKPLAASPALGSSPSAGGEAGASAQRSLQLYRGFNATRRSLQKAALAQTMMLATVDFRRIWTDHGGMSGGEGMSVWRPQPPRGYSAVGERVVMFRWSMPCRDASGICKFSCVVVSVCLPWLDQPGEVCHDTLCITASTGDCWVRGMDPPASAVVLSEAGDHGTEPLLRSPRAFQLVWQDEAVRDTQRLSIWKPVPPQGCAVRQCLQIVPNVVQSRGLG